MTDGTALARVTAAVDQGVRTWLDVVPDTGDTVQIAIEVLEAAAPVVAEFAARTHDFPWESLSARNKAKAIVQARRALGLSP